MLLLAALCVAFSTADIADLANIEQIGHGYDIFKGTIGSPRETHQTDPGKRAAIFDVGCPTCYSKNQTIDRKYRVPDAVGARLAPMCSYTATVFEVHDTFDLQEALNYYIRKSHHVLFFSSSSTNEYHMVQEFTQKGQFVFTKAIATCASYTAQLNAYSLGSEQLQMNSRGLWPVFQLCTTRKTWILSCRW
jgi:hypothetical protein